MTTFPFPKWKCAAPTCRERAYWRIEISTTVFITCCDQHKHIYERIMPGVFKRLSGSFRVPEGWVPMFSSARWGVGEKLYGATKER